MMMMMMACVMPEVVQDKQHCVCSETLCIGLGVIYAVGLFFSHVCPASSICGQDCDVIYGPIFTKFGT